MNIPPVAPATPEDGRSWCRRHAPRTMRLGDPREFVRIYSTVSQTSRPG
jgi:hypothetical protein